MKITDEGVNKGIFVHVGLYVLVITRPGGILLIYKREPEVRPEGECLYYQQHPDWATGCVLSDLLIMLGGCCLVT